MIGRRKWLSPALLEGAAVMVCFVSVVRLLGMLGAGDAVDETLKNAASRGDLVAGAIKMEAGELPNVYSAALAAQSGIGAAAEAALQTASPPATPEISQVVPVQPDDPEPTLTEAFSPVTPQLEEDGDVEFDAADAASIEYTNETAYTPDNDALLQEPLDIDFDADGPLVLIVHTHASEAYTPEYEGQFETNDNWRTTDLDHSVVRVGDVLEQTLIEAGVGVVHDRTVSDYPTYTGSYTRTLSVIQSYLDAYPSIQMVIDLHRDAGITDDGEAVATWYDSPEGRTSQVMLVVGTDEGGLSHPGWRENLKLALRLQALTNREYLGLMRPINLRQERFNQHMTAGSLIVEVGFAGNFLCEAEEAARLFGKSLTQLILSEK